MAIWMKFKGWTYEYFERDVEPQVLPGLEDLVRLWQDKRGDRVVPSWSDFDFCDFMGWHSRISLYENHYDPFDYHCRLSGTKVDRVFDRPMTGAKGWELAGMRVEYAVTMEFQRMTCSQMLIARRSGPVNLKGREHLQATFIAFPLSKEGPRATHTLEFLVSPTLP